VFCTGKIYYDLTSEPRPSHVAIVRIEGLYPWPQDEVAHVLERYAEADDIVWVQEEPKNMGAWSFVMQRLSGIRYIGRPDRASPAEGYMASHQKEQARIVAEALAAPIASDRPSIAGGV